LDCARAGSARWFAGLHRCTRLFHTVPTFFTYAAGSRLAFTTAIRSRVGLLHCPAYRTAQFTVLGSRLHYRSFYRTTFCTLPTFRFLPLRFGSTGSPVIHTRLPRSSRCVGSHYGLRLHAVCVTAFYVGLFTTTHTPFYLRSPRSSFYVRTHTAFYRAFAAPHGLRLHRSLRFTTFTFYTSTFPHLPDFTTAFCGCLLLLLRSYAVHGYCLVTAVLPFPGWLPLLRFCVVRCLVCGLHCVSPRILRLPLITGSRVHARAAFHSSPRLRFTFTVLRTPRRFCCRLRYIHATTGCGYTPLPLGYRSVAGYCSSCRGLRGCCLLCRFTYAARTFTL